MSGRRGKACIGDPLLKPRLLEFAESHDLNDADEAVEYLRDMWPEYRRKKIEDLRRSIIRMTQVIEREAGSVELALQQREQQYLAKRKGNPSPQSGNSASKSPQGKMEVDSDDSMGEVQYEETKRNTMNDSLRANLYRKVQFKDDDDTPSTPATTTSTGKPDTPSTPATPLGISTPGSESGKRKTPPASEDETGGQSSKRKKREERRKKQSSGSRSSEGNDEASFVTPKASYEDVGGIEQCLQDVRELIEYPLSHPEIYQHLGVEPPRGILLHGPPGCGKTLLANAIAGEIGVPFMKISAPEIVSGMSGESEKKVRGLFSEAIANSPCIVFIDEIDAVTPKRETAQKEMERRIVAQLLTCMDDLSQPADQQGSTPRGHVIVIGATNRPDSLDPALRRAGRFDREIALGIPDEGARERILKVLCRKLKIDGEMDFKKLAKATPGFVGADLTALTKEAAVLAVNRIFAEIYGRSEEPAPSDASEPSNVLDHVERSRVSDILKTKNEPLTDEQLQPLSITFSDFQNAIKFVQPSAKREGFATIPDVTWEDIGALEELREELDLAIVQPISNPERFETMGLAISAGILFYGPPGCGKTLLAKAVANESGANFISIKGPELLNKYVGESERAVRQVFQRARSSAPCVIFFDELDALVPKRGTDGNQVTERVVNQLLTEMDGLEPRKQVFVVAATNRPDIIDSAMLRPGRLDKLLYVPLPGPNDRQSILLKLTRKTPMTNVDIRKIAFDSRCEGFSGADLGGLVREASVLALKEAMKVPSTTGIPVTVRNDHFNLAFETCMPSVSRQDQAMFNKMKSKLRKARSRLSSTTPGNSAVVTSQTPLQPSPNIAQVPASSVNPMFPVAEEDPEGEAAQVPGSNELEFRRRGTTL